MNIFTFLSYLNKISLLAFFLTAGFLFYQLYLLKKTSTPKEEKLKIPDFNENIKINVENFTKLPDSMTKVSPIQINKDNKLFLFILAGLGGLTIILFIIISLKSTPSTTTPSVSVQITLTPSPTIKSETFLSVSPTETDQAGLKPILTLTPTSTPFPTKTVLSETPTPTEVILAIINPTETIQTESPTPNSSLISPTTSPTTISNLPITGVVDRGLAFFAIAALLIFFSFVF